MAFYTEGEPVSLSSEPRLVESPNTRLLYCAYDRRVTRHARHGLENVMVCLECGRRVPLPAAARTPSADDGELSQRTTVLAPVVELSGARSRTAAARAARRNGKRSWLPLGLAAVAIVVGALAIASIVRSVAAPSPEPVALPEQTSGPAAAQPAPAEPSSVRIANTDGQGAYLRRTPNLDDRLRPWQDGTTLKVTGPDSSVNGITWKPVEDPAGNRGWIPAQYTAP
jgi:hypothetical protein